MKIADLRKWGDKIGRANMAESVQEAISEYDGSYKGAMELCGKLSVIAKASTFDDYWHEQVGRGEIKQKSKIEMELKK